MAYRMFVFLALLGFIACGDDAGSNTTKMDAPAATDDSGGSGTDDAAVADAPGSTVDAGVGASCGNTTCTSTQECCFTGGGSAGTCVAQGTCSGVSFACDGPEDCASNQVCCYGNQGSGSGGTGGSECKLTAQCQINACHDDTDCSGGTSKCCPVAMTTYKVCLAQCPMM